MTLAFAWEKNFKTGNSLYTSGYSSYELVNNFSWCNSMKSVKIQVFQSNGWSYGLREMREWGEWGSWGGSTWLFKNYWKKCTYKHKDHQRRVNKKPVGKGSGKKRSSRERIADAIRITFKGRLEISLLVEFISIQAAPFCNIGTFCLCWSWTLKSLHWLQVP